MILRIAVHAPSAKQEREITKFCIIRGPIYMVSGTRDNPSPEGFVCENGFSTRRVKVDPARSSFIILIE